MTTLFAVFCYTGNNDETDDLIGYVEKEDDAKTYCDTKNKESANYNKQMEEWVSRYRDWNAKSQKLETLSECIRKLERLQDKCKELPDLTKIPLDRQTILIENINKHNLLCQTLKLW